MKHPKEVYDPYGAFGNDEPIKVYKLPKKEKKMENCKEPCGRHMIHHVDCPSFHALCAILCCYFVAKIILLVYNAGEMQEVVMKFVE